jgi:hypothetical protein
MEYSEIFLLSSTIISLITGVRLFYQNCNLTVKYYKSLEIELELTEELILAYKEIEDLKKKLK